MPKQVIDTAWIIQTSPTVHVCHIWEVSVTGTVPRFHCLVISVGIIFAYHGILYTRNYD